MLSPIAQFVRRRYLATIRGGPAARQVSRVWLKAEQALGLLGDPCVTHDVGPFRLELPVSHALPRILQALPQYNQNLGRIGQALFRKYPDLRAIDVGANVGDSVAILRARATFPILCVEANPRFFRLLEVNTRQFPAVTLVPAYLGEEDRAVAGKLETKQGTAMLTGGASDPSPGRTLRTRTLAGLLEEFPDFAAARLLKIDTDGYDNKIIRGAAPYLARATPVLFFEYDPYFLSLQNDDGVSVFPLLRDLGYRHMLVYDNEGPFHHVASPDDAAAVAELHRWAGRAPGAKYADLCVFHGTDADLFESLRHSEAAAAAAAAAGAGA